MWKSVKENFDSPDSYVSLALGLAVVLVVGMITFNYFKAKLSPEQTKQVETTQESAQTTALPAKHTVKEGETLWSIAEEYYKSGYNWTDIQKANNLADAGLVEKGQVLTIPDVKPVVMEEGQVSSASTDMKKEQKTYTVVHGDTLWSIAVKEYNDGYKWLEIAKKNNLDNPDVIHTGNTLILP